MMSPSRSLSMSIHRSSANHDGAGCGRGGGFSIVEAVFAVLLVGLTFVVALQTVAGARTTLTTIGAGARADLLAGALVEEILTLRYEDPDVSGNIGPGSDETGTGDRTLFDDVDDYHGWSATPPERRDGTAIPGFEGWERTVTVEWVDPADLDETLSSESGMKRITVTVRRGDKRLARRIAYRAAGHISPVRDAEP